MNWNYFARSESSWEAEGKRWQSRKQVTETLSLLRTGNSWVLLPPSHLPFSYSGFLWYFQSDSKIHSMKTIIVLAFAPLIFWLLSRHQVISVYNTRASLTCWFRAIQLKEVCKSSDIFTERDFTKQKYFPVQISLANTDDLLHCKNAKSPQSFMEASRKTLHKTMPLSLLRNRYIARCVVATSDFV